MRLCPRASFLFFWNFGEPKKFWAPLGERNISGPTSVCVCARVRVCTKGRMEGALMADLLMSVRALEVHDCQVGAKSLGARAWRASYGIGARDCSVRDLNLSGTRGFGVGRNDVWSQQDFWRVGE